MESSLEQNNLSILQGDIIGNVGCIQRTNTNGDLVNSYLFPFVVFLSQSCDLQWHFKKSNNLLPILVSPMHKYSEFLDGKPFEELGIKRDSFQSKEWPSSSC
jgi:hypothetical protein